MVNTVYKCSMEYLPSKEKKMLQLARVPLDPVHRGLLLRRASRHPRCNLQRDGGGQSEGAGGSSVLMRMGRR